MDKAQQKTPKNRSASRRKAAKILDAARIEFFDKGFSAASIESIAARAEVSKVTIYNHFGDKENLFAEVVSVLVQQMRQNFFVEQLTDQDLRDILYKAALGMLNILLRDDMVRFERILAAEVNRDPKIGEYFLKNGPLTLLATLTELLTAAAEKGEIKSDDPRHSAELFAGLVMGRMDFLLRYGHKLEMTQADREQRARRAVDGWMLIHAP